MLRTDLPRHTIRRRVEGLESRTVPAVVNWTLGADGDFANAAAWTDNLGVHRVPGPGDDARIDGQFSVTSSANRTVNSITATGFRVLGGTFAVQAVDVASGVTDLTVAAGAGLSLLGGTGEVQVVGSEVAGTLAVAAGSRLRFLRGVHNFNAGTALTGAGQFVVQGDAGGAATVNVNAPLTASADFELGRGTLQGPADFTVPSGATFRWSAGRMGGTGDTVVAAGATALLTPGLNHELADERTFDIFGAVSHTGFGLSFFNAAALRVRGGGSYALASDVDFGTNPSALGGVQIDAGGLFVKSSPTGTGLSVVNVPVNTAGTVRVDSGTLRIDQQQASVFAGPFQLAGGLELAGGSFGFGTFAVNPGTTFAGAGSLWVRTGTTTLNAPISVANYVQTGGNVTGPAGLTLTGAATWNGGAMSGTSTTAVAAGATLDLVSGTADGRTLRVAGAATTGALFLANAGSLVVEPGGSYAVGAGGIGSSGLFASTVVNRGLFVKQGATNSNVQVSAITNEGTIRMDGTGFLGLFNTTQTAGSIAITAGGQVQFQGGLQLAGGTLAGSGSVQGNIVSAGTGAVSPGLAGPGVLTTQFTNFQQGGPLAIDLNGPAAGTGYDQLVVDQNVTLSGPLLLSVGFAVPAGTQFRILDKTGGGAVSGTLAGLPEGATVTANGQAFTVSYVGGDGNDVVLTRTNAPAAPPRVTGVTANAGQANEMQRSRVTSLAVRFDSVVTFANNDVAAAFGLSRIGGGAVGGFTATAATVNGVTVVTLTGFSGSETQFGSLADGRFSVLVRANLVSAGGQQLDGDGNGQGGDDYTLNGTTANGLFRLYADVNGDGVVNAFDFSRFRGALGSSTGQAAYLDFLDFNNDGTINAADFGQFRNRFGSGVP